MNLTKEQNLEIRKKRQSISYGLTELLCNKASGDHEYLLNLIIAQQELAQMLSSYQDLAFIKWDMGKEEN